MLFSGTLRAMLPPIWYHVLRVTHISANVILPTCTERDRRSVQRTTHVYNSTAEQGLEEGRRFLSYAAVSSFNTMQHYNIVAGDVCST